MTAAYGNPSDLRLADTSQLLEQSLDPLRTVCLPFADEVNARAALIGLTNSKGGDILFGASADDARARVVALPGIEPSWLDQHLADLVARIDPPITDFIQARMLSPNGATAVGVVSVRQSPVPPHIDMESGVVFLHENGMPRPIASRFELDQLYKKGRTLNERAERLIEAMAERLTLAHFGHYGVAVIACLRDPAADPYLWASEETEALADIDDPFIQRWGLAAGAARISSSEVELRSEREICGLLRVGRAGFVVAAEILRRPQGDVLASAKELCEQVSRLVTVACRVLAHSEATSIVPHLLCDGLRGAKIRATEIAGSETVASGVDALRVPGPAGDARDGAYQQQIAREFGRALLAPFGIHDLPDVSP